MSGQSLRAASQWSWLGILGSGSWVAATWATEPTEAEEKTGWQTEAEVEAGTRHPAETAKLKNELEAIVEREQRMMVRETQLANELETERAKLNELNDKLNLLLEQDLSPR